MIFIGVLFLLIASVSAAPSYDEILEKGMVDDIVQREKSHILYTLSPSSVTESHTATISTVAFINTSFNDSIELYLYRQGEDTSIPMTEFIAEDNAENNSYYLTSWNVTPINDTTYTLSLIINGNKAYEKDILVKTVARNIVDQDVKEQSVPVNILKDEAQKEKIRNLLSEAGYSYTPLEFDTLQEEARELLDIRKVQKSQTIKYDDNTSETITTIYFSVEPKNEGDVMETVQIIENIPKIVVNHTDLLVFPEVVPEILEEDPVIMWHMEDLETEESASYEVESNQSVTGNTIVLAKRDQETSDNPLLKILLAIILIPIIVGIIIYFNKYAPEHNN
ncbi:MAG: hypothetical protein ACQESE_01235 [Nanobdellota archaeon]